MTTLQLVKFEEKADIEYSEDLGTKGNWRMTEPPFPWFFTFKIQDGDLYMCNSSRMCGEKYMIVKANGDITSGASAEWDDMEVTREVSEDE